MRAYERPSQTASNSQATDRTRFAAMNPSGRMLTRAPTHTSAADMTSPARTTNVSTTCFALYFASLDVKSQRVCRVVFESE